MAALSDSVLSGIIYHDEDTEALVQAYLQDVHYTGRYQAIFNIVYALINGGLVGLPYTAAQSGVLVYSVMIVIIGVISAYSAILVIQMASDHKLRTLEDLGERAFGHKGYYIISAFQLIYCLALMSISLSLYADIFSDIFTRYYEKNDKAGTKLPYMLCAQQGQVLMGGLFVLVLCCATRSLVSLRFSSYFTALAVSGSIVAVAGSLISDTYIDSTPKVSGEVIQPHPQWWVFAFIIPFCFSFNQKALTVYACLRRRTAKRWKFSVIRAMGVVIIVYLLFGNVGYIAQKILSRPVDVLDYFLMHNIPGNRVFIDVISGLVAISLLLTVPVDCLVASTTMKRLYRRYRRNALSSCRIINDSKRHAGEGSGIANQQTYQYQYTAVNNTANILNRNDSYLTDTTADTNNIGKKAEKSLLGKLASFFGNLFSSESDESFTRRSSAAAAAGGGGNMDNRMNNNKHLNNNNNNINTKDYKDWDFDPNDLVKPYVPSSSSSSSSSNNNSGSSSRISSAAPIQSADSSATIVHSLIHNQTIKADNNNSEFRSSDAVSSDNSSLNGSDIRDSGQLFDMLDQKASRSDYLLSLQANTAAVAETNTNPLNNNNNSYSNVDSNANNSNNTDNSKTIASPTRTPQYKKISPNIVLGNSAELNRIESINSDSRFSETKDYSNNYNNNNNSNSNNNNKTNSSDGSSNRNNKKSNLNDDDDDDDDDDEEEDGDEYELNQRLISGNHLYEEGGRGGGEAGEFDIYSNSNSNRESFYSNYSVYGPSVKPSGDVLNSKLRGFQHDDQEQTWCSSSLSVYDLLPGFSLWLVTLGFCMLGRRYLALACGLGTIANAILMYILPSMLYFRIGVLSDFQAIPVFGLIPNRALMYLLQLFGLLLLSSLLGIMLYSLVDNLTVFRDHDHGVDDNN